MIVPQFVKAYVKSNKNDANDAEAICEAMSRPHMRLVSVKTVEQQDIQAVHRIRAELSKQRTAKGNQLRGLVAEYGLVAPKELVQLHRQNPRMAKCEHDKAMGSRRANSPSWPSIVKSMRQLEAGYT